MRDACWESSESLVSLVYCDHSARMVLLRSRHSNKKPFSHRGRAVTIKERDVV